MAIERATPQQIRERALARIAALEARVGPVRRDVLTLVPMPPRPEEADARLAALEIRAGIRGGRTT